MHRSESRPGGVSLGRALVIGAGVINDELREVVAVIDRIHGDGALPAIPVSFVPNLRNPAGHSIDGAFIYDVTVDEAIVARSIRIRRSAPHIAFVVLHEIGHLLDAVALPGDGFASEGDPLLRLWRRAVLRSRLWQELEHRSETDDRTDRQRARTLMQPAELWARSYAQFVSVRSGNEILRQALHALRFRHATDLYFPRQWDDEDFSEIERSIDEVFRSQGWIVR